MRWLKRVVAEMLSSGSAAEREQREPGLRNSRMTSDRDHLDRARDRERDRAARRC